MEWSKDEIKLLRELKSKGKTIADIAKIINRSYCSVEQKIRHESVQVTSPRDISSTEVLDTKKETLDITTIKDIFAQLNLKLKEQKLMVNYPKTKKEQISILDISDVHVGMCNKVFDAKLGMERVTYNYEIFLKELEVLREAVFRIYNLQSKAYNLKTLYINLLGDIVTNDRIFMNQQLSIDRCVGQQIWDSVANLAGLIENFKAIYQNIEVTCVVGNHGRSTTDFMEEPVQNNFEYHLYKILQLIFAKDDRVQITVPTTRRFIVNIGGWRHLLEHGDSIKGYSDAAIQKSVKELIINVGEFDVIDFGHFHKLSETGIGDDSVLVKRNGGWISKDNYAFTKFKEYSEPKQWFYGCTKNRKETWSYKIDLKK